MGTIRVDERPVIARTTVSHPSHQPFGDTSVEHAVDLEPEHLDFSTWRDVAKEGYVTNTTTHLPGQNAAPVTRLVWQPSCIAPEVPFVVGICGGAQGYVNDLCERTKTKISTADKTHARTGPDTQRAQAHNHTQTSNSRTLPRQTSNLIFRALRKIMKAQ